MDNALGIDDTDCLCDAVHRELPLAFAVREELDEASVLERDRGLCRDRRDEGAVGRRVGADRVAGDGNGADDAPDGGDRHADPAAGWHDRRAQRDALGRGPLGHLVREHQRSLPERELEEGVVGGGGARGLVVRDDQAVGIDVQQSDRELVGNERHGHRPGDDVDDRRRAIGAGELLGERRQTAQDLTDPIAGSSIDWRLRHDPRQRARPVAGR